MVTLHGVSHRQLLNAAITNVNDKELSDTVSNFRSRNYKLLACNYDTFQDVCKRL